MKYIKLQFIEAQFEALIDITETIKAMIGVGCDFDTISSKNVRLIYRMLKKNGYEIKFKCRDTAEGNSA